MKRILLSLSISLPLMIILYFVIVPVHVNYIYTSDDLQDIKEGYNVLMADIDLDGYEWIPINGEGINLDGNGYVITNLTIRDQEDISYYGLLGKIENSEITNIQLEEVSIDVSTSFGTGAVAGKAESTIISNTSVTGSIDGSTNVGGIVGSLEWTWFRNSSPSYIKNSFTSASVNGNRFVGGIVGALEKASIYNVYSTGNISGTSNIGGISGRLYNSSIVNSYSTGNISGVDFVFGVGNLSSNFSYIHNCYVYSSQVITSEDDIVENDNVLEIDEFSSEWFLNSDNWHSTSPWDEDIWSFDDLSEYGPKLKI